MLARRFDDEDIFGNGLPPSCRHLPAGLTPKKLWGPLPNAEWANPHCMGDPWFRYFDKEVIDSYIEAVHKVVANTDALLAYKGTADYAYWK